MKNILILTSGNVNKISAFARDGVTLASFKDVSYTSEEMGLKLKTGEDIKDFSIIYFRIVGKSLEIASLVADYAIKNGIKIVDEMYETSHLLPISLGKSLEMRKLNESGVKIPKTVFGDFSSMSFPYIVKSTSGQRAREVWLVNNEAELDELKKKFEKGKFYFAQELVPNARRIRALVIGDKVVGAIVRHTKWNKDHTKITLDPIPDEVSKLALDSAKSVQLDISGIDILVNSVTNEMYVIEANAAPAWELINKYCKVNVEDEIIKYLQTKI